MGKGSRKNHGTVSKAKVALEMRFLFICILIRIGMTVCDRAGTEPFDVMEAKK